MNLKKSLLKAFIKQKWIIICILAVGIVIAVSTANIPSLIGKCYQAVITGAYAGASPFVLLAAAYSLRSVFKITRNHLAAVTGTDIVRCLRMELVRFFGKSGSNGEADPIAFYSLCSHDIETLSQVVSWKSFLFIENIYILILSFYYIYCFDQAVFFAVVPFLILLITASCIYGLHINQLLYDIHSSVAGISSALYETVTVQKAIRSLKAEKYFEEKFNKKNEENRELNIRLRNKTKGFNWMVDIISLSAMAAAVIGTALVLQRQNSSGEMILTIYNYMFLLLGTSKGMAEIILFYVSSKQNLWRMEQFAGRMAVEDSACAVACADKITSLEFRNTSYIIEGKVIFNQSMRFEKGQLAVIEGASGTGKTIAADILAGLNLRYEGQVIVNDNYELKCLMPDTYRRHIGYGMQSTVIFYGTLEENILLGRKPVKERELNELYDRAGIWDIAERMQEGIKTFILGSSNTLSGGQKQRIGFARALAAEADVIILDDIFAALDVERQKEMLRLLDKWKENHIIIMISSYDMVKKTADRVYRMGD